MSPLSGKLEAVPTHVLEGSAPRLHWTRSREDQAMIGVYQESKSRKANIDVWNTVGCGTLIARNDYAIE